MSRYADPIAMGVYTRVDSPFFWLLLERPNGKPIRESSGIPIDGGSPDQNKELRRQAQQVYAARMTDLARLRFKLPTDLKRRTFAQHRVWYLEHVTARKRGKRTETSMLRRLAQYFDRYDLQDITYEVAREWRTWRLQDVTVATVTREEEVLRHLLTTAVPTYLDKNPLAGLTKLRIPGRDTRIFTPQEERRLLAKAKKPEDYALLLCALDTLLRLTNVRELTRAQDHRTYLFSDTKTTAIKIPISRRLRKALNALPMAGRSYFPSYAHGTPNKAIRMFEATCRRAKIPLGRETGGVSFHCLRHTGASRMLERGADVKTVMRIGGWTNLAVLERYLHPTDAAATRAVNSIAGVRGA